MVHEHHNLEQIQNLTGSQWSSQRDEMMCDQQSSRITRHAAAFYKRWSGAVVDASRLARMMLQ